MKHILFTWKNLQRGEMSFECWRHRLLAGVWQTFGLENRRIVSQILVMTIEELNTKTLARFLFGSHETSPTIWIGKPTPSIQC
jgi:hypothetical protein